LRGHASNSPRTAQAADEPGHLQEKPLAALHQKKEQINGMKNALYRFIYRESLLLIK
jgi:hypothetical protein